MKLLCVNASTLVINGINCFGQDLVEGKEYNTRGDTYTDVEGFTVYYVDGIGGRLACRFIPVLEETTFAKKQLEELSLN